MASVYFKSRQEAGQMLVEHAARLKELETTVISLDTDSLIIGAQLSQFLQSPLQLFLSTEIDVPGGLSIGGVNQDGGFSTSAALSEAEAEYWNQEYRGYIEESKRTAFSALNRELGSSEIFKRELIRNKHIVIVSDCITDTVGLESLIEALKSTKYSSINVFSPIVKGGLVSRLKEISDESYFIGTIDFFYGKDHYYEDNTVYGREEGIKTVSDYLRMWPTPV